MLERKKNMSLFYVSISFKLCQCYYRRLSGVQHKVKCDTAEMTVQMILPDTVTDVYLEGMKEYGKDIGIYINISHNHIVRCQTTLFYPSQVANP